MRSYLVAAAISAAVAVPAAAQSLNDVGRLLQRQIAPGQQQPNQQDREREIYEQGRRDQEETRRDELRRRDEAGRGRDERRGDDRRRAEDRNRLDRNQDRQRTDQRRTYDDDQRTREQPGRY